MYCPEFSYWVSATPVPKDGTPAPDPAGLLKALSESGLAAPEGPLSFKIDGYGVQGEVVPEKGTVPRDPGLAELLKAVSGRFPGYRFSLDEDNEEDTADRKRTVFEAGAVVSETYARTLDPSQLDYATLEAVSQKMREAEAGLRDNAKGQLAGNEPGLAHARLYAADAIRKLIDEISAMAR